MKFTFKHNCLRLLYKPRLAFRVKTMFIILGLSVTIEMTNLESYLRNIPRRYLPCLPARLYTKLAPLCVYTSRVSACREPSHLVVSYGGMFLCFYLGMRCNQYINISLSLHSKYILCLKTVEMGYLWSVSERYTCTVRGKGFNLNAAVS